MKFEFVADSLPYTVRMVSRGFARAFGLIAVLMFTGSPLFGVMCDLVCSADHNSQAVGHHRTDGSCHDAPAASVASSALAPPPHCTHQAVGSTIGNARGAIKIPQSPVATSTPLALASPVPARRLLISIQLGSPPGARLGSSVSILRI